MQQIMLEVTGAGGECRSTTNRQAASGGIKRPPPACHCMAAGTNNMTNEAQVPMHNNNFMKPETLSSKPCTSAAPAAGPEVYLVGVAQQVKGARRPALRPLLGVR